MIYDYEANVLKYINQIVPSLRLMTYAKQQDMFNAMSQVTKFPAFFYYREPINWTFNKIYPVSDGSSNVNFSPYEQTYVGRILLENQSNVFDLASNMRFAWHRNPYLNVAWPTASDTVKVGLRLLYIKVDEDRAPDDKKGTQRYVEFSWKSQLFFYENTTLPLAEQINIHLFTDDSYTESQIYNGDNLIKTIRV